MDTQLTIEEIALLRQTAAATIADYPYRPLMLELALVGLSRYALSNLTIHSFVEAGRAYKGKEIISYQRCVHWHVRNKVEKHTRLTESQWNIVQDYLKWRQVKAYLDSDNLFVRLDKHGYWHIITYEEIRHDIKKLSKDCFLAADLEIPDLHRSMANIMRFQRVPEALIYEMYGQKRYRKKS
jgi:hypothetical protein